MEEEKQQNNYHTVSFILALIACYIFQYSISYTLIALGYYSNNIYSLGGFIVNILLFAWLIKLILKRLNKDSPLLANNKLNIIHNFKTDNIYRSFISLLLVGGYFQSSYFTTVQYHYEYDNYGITSKASITKKEANKNGNASMTYYFTFSLSADNQTIERKYSTINKKYKKLNIGDTCLIMYSPRKRYFTEILSQ